IAALISVFATPSRAERSAGETAPSAKTARRIRRRRDLLSCVADAAIFVNRKLFGIRTSEKIYYNYFSDSALRRTIVYNWVGRIFQFAMNKTETIARIRKTGVLPVVRAASAADAALLIERLV